MQRNNLVSAGAPPAEDMEKQVINHDWYLLVTLSMQKIPSEWPRGMYSAQNIAVILSLSKDLNLLLFGCIRTFDKLRVTKSKHASAASILFWYYIISYGRPFIL